jgi:hypothetical protein
MIPAILGALTGFGLVVVLPIVAVLTAHQRKMAEVYARSAAAAQPNPELQSLRQEIRELKDLVHQQAIALDSANRLGPPATPTVEQRLEGIR